MQGKSAIPPEMLRVLGVIKAPPLTPPDADRLNGLKITGVWVDELEPPHLGAYAPDPDADFKAGVRHGYQLGLYAPSPIRWEHKQVGRRVEIVKLALAILAIIGVTVAMVS